MIPVIGAIVFPLILSVFSILLPRQAERLGFLPCGWTICCAIWIIAREQVVQLNLLGSFGVSLAADSSAAYFLLTNGLICLSVFFYIRQQRYSPFFFSLLMILHGGINACFLSNDLFNLYVVIELTTIVAFLMIIHPMGERPLWNGLRYLFISNVGMLFYLVGILMVYQSCGSYDITGLAKTHSVAAALVIGGLMVKGGVFIPGLWLPMAHAEADTPVSALLSGVVVKIGVLPLLKFATISESLNVMIRLLGTAGALTGIFFALFERDVKRLLACSTLSQIGFILAAPAVGAFSALAHGLAKSALFLASSGLPSRDLTKLKGASIHWQVWLMLLLPALSICGLPFFAGFSAKKLTFDYLLPWQNPLMWIASVGTTLVLARLVFFRLHITPSPSFAWIPSLLLVAGLFFAEVKTSHFDKAAVLTALGILLAGWGLHWIAFKRLMRVTLPDRWERLEDVVGLTCISLLAMMFMRVGL